MNIADLICNIRPDLKNKNLDNLIDDNILSSLDIINIVTEIKNNYNINIPLTEFVPNNFNSVKDIENMISRIKENL